MVVMIHHVYFWTLCHPCITSLLCNNNLYGFLEIHLQLDEIRVAKTRLGLEIMKT